MDIKVVGKEAISSKIACVVVPVLEDVSILSGALSELDAAFQGQIKTLIKKKIFKGKKKETHVLNGLGKELPEWTVLLGLGKKETLTYEEVRHGAAEAAKRVKKCQASRSVWYIDAQAFPGLELPLVGKALAEGIEMGLYSFDMYRTKQEDKQPDIKEIVLVSDAKGFSDAVEEGSIVGQAVNRARDLANMAPNDLTPQIFVDAAKGLFKDTAVTVEVIDKKKAKTLGMHAFLGVAQGSVEEPFMLVLNYRPLKNKKPIALVGKGVTFDSGGISIKPSAKMSEMKGDMSGAAAVLATMYAVSELNPKKNIMAVMALTENMPSGIAQRPGDVVRAMNGKTIEIINTDAEGRLVLADALCYAVSEGVSEIADIATLTGACSVALGDIASAILGNNQALIDRFIALSEASGERLWQLPLYDEYKDYMKSECADLANASENRLGGTIYGAKFLEEFVDKTPWVHLDVASMMHYATASGYRVKGMSGVGVRNLIAYCLESQ